MNRRKAFMVLLDVLLIPAGFLITVWLKGGGSTYFSGPYLYGLLVLIGVWLAVSFTANKFDTTRTKKLSSINLRFMGTNFIILSIMALLMYSFRSIQYSRFVVFGTIVVSTVLEVFFTDMYYYLKVANGNRRNGTRVKPEHDDPVTEAVHQVRVRDISLSETQLKKDIIGETGPGVYDFIARHIDLLDSKNLVIATTTRFNILYQPDHHFAGIVNLKRINDIRYINKFFETVNSKLPTHGRFIGCVETKELRKKRILKKYMPVFNRIVYFMDYIVKRVFPKFMLTKKLYFFLTRGENRVLSRTETLGRLISCGFEVLHEEYVNGLMFFITRKVKKPVFDLNPSYGPFVRLKRIGRNGDFIRVYKMRTMHPYAEYLQDYVFEKYNLQEGGKFNNDFRVTGAGKLMRTLWIDELPMLINWLRGDLKLVGVRPISQQYFNLYSKKHRQRRKKYQPGLIPPYYAHLPQTLQEIEASESRFLDEYDRHPFRTNWKYFWKALYNIIFKKVRSR